MKNRNVEELPSKAAVYSPFRRVAHHDVELRGKLADLRRPDRREIHDHRLARSRVADPIENPVANVARVSFDVALSRELVVTFHPNQDVNVRREPSGVHDWPDRPKSVF